jgi:quercetin dioxygenase-like cupin family protein
MAIHHAKPGELIDIRPLGAQLAASQTTTLIKTDTLEVIRLVLPAGKEVPPHRVNGEITVQCLEGNVEFSASGVTRPLTSGSLLFLRGSEEHTLRAIADSSVLVTILLTARQS